eukprot:CAMPEP_0201680892 /NCGR_PEP_ID=MMETSP0494-20130426/50832_1 /ASSEMBLY_ACC=CAM_ASM_000839 /TAXON_ID=420259 /ORGANISM="Thalassiosira gravida, Strain GMp14c1" /LENGTH=366 /DNA_ID=CAMNT_0048164619 /DNA_START=12 /DNA_END=1112 /DNA_ORIENTATION=-
MAAVGITIAKRTAPSLVSKQLAGIRKLTLNHAAPSHRCHSIRHRNNDSRLFVMAMTTKNAPTSTITGSFNHNITPANSTFSPLGSTIRSFGRKGSRMGHHIQNLDEMAHNDSREEAKHRREKKKKKNKKARIQSNKDETSSEKDVEADDTASGSGGGGGGGTDDNFGPKEDEFGNPLLPEPTAVRSKMLMIIASLERSFASLRGGEATPELFDAVRVSAYGETVPLSSVGQVVIEDAQRATISCFDPSVANDVRDAVRDMQGTNLNPYVEEGGSGVVVVPIPRASDESRREMAKELGRQAENGKRRVRKIRRGAMDVVSKGKQGKLDGISKDDAFRVGKEVEAATEEVLLAFKGIVEKKQRSVMDD